MRVDFSKAQKYGRKGLSAALIGTVASLVLLEIFAFLIWRGTVPESMMRELALAAAFGGAMAAGLRIGEGVIGGAAGGLAYLIAATIIGLYRAQGAYFNLDYIRLAIASLAAGAFGGIISTGKKNKKRLFHKKKYTVSNHRKKLT
jgi:putative membrane protein (TIGR04086 family)